MLPQIGTHDLQQRYKKCYLELSIHDKPMVGFVSGIDQEGIEIHGVGDFRTANVSILREFPEMGLVNYGGSVHILSRRPIRQWSRGFREDVFFDFCRNRKVPAFHNGMNLSAAQAVFNRVWIPVKEGLIKLREEAIISFAIDNKYWFSGNKNHQYLWRNKVCIGEVVNKRIFFFKESTLLQEEITTDLGNIHEHF